MEGCVGMCCHLGGSAVVLRRVGRCWPTWFRFLVDMCEKEVRLEAPKVHTAASGLALDNVQLPMLKLQEDCFLLEECYRQSVLPKKPSFSLLSKLWHISAEKHDSR